MRLLVCDLTPTSPAVSEQLAMALRADGFELDTVSSSADAAWRATEATYAAVIVGANDSGRADRADLLTAVEAIRRDGVGAPVIVLTPNPDPDAEARLLDAGADDHVVVPVAPALLIARIQAQRRRTETSPSAPLRAGPFTLDPTQLVATGPDDTTIELTQREFALIEVLARRAPEPVDKLTLLDAVWGLDFDGDPNVVEVYVGYLRKKLGRATIRTVRGVGYRVDSPDQV